MSKQGKLIMSFHQGGKVTDGKGKKVKATAVQKKAIQATKKSVKHLSQLPLLSTLVVVSQ